MTGQDRDNYRMLTAAAVLLVAAIAACVSFIHIEALAIRYGQPRLAAVLLPVSIDGTVAVSSLALLRSARSALSAPWLARTGLVLSVGATVACNVGYGLAHGLPGALLSGWPAVAFILSAETAIGMSRRTARPSRQAAAAEASAKPAAKSAARSTRKASQSGADAATRRATEAITQGQPVPSARELARVHHIGRDKASQVRAAVLAAANGQAPA